MIAEQLIEDSLIADSQQGIITSQYLYGTGGHVVTIGWKHGKHWTGLAQWGAHITSRGVIASGYAVHEAQGDSLEAVQQALWACYADSE